MAKPICIIYVDVEQIPKHESRWEVLSKLSKNYEERMPDYHIFVLPNNAVSGSAPLFEFKVIYEKDFTEVQYNELKSIIEDHLQKQIKP